MNILRAAKLGASFTGSYKKERIFHFYNSDNIKNFIMFSGNIERKI